MLEKIEDTKGVIESQIPKWSTKYYAETNDWWTHVLRESE
jgi:hypothetical protein